MRQFLLTVVFFIFFQNGYCQTYAYYRTGTRVKYFTFSPNINIKETNRKFPAYSDDLEALSKSYVVPSQTTIILKKTNFDKIIAAQHLMIRCFTENIGLLEFIIKGRGFEKKIMPLKVENQGYQYPADLKLDSVSFQNQDSIALIISFDKIRADREAMLVIGDLWIGENKIQKHISSNNTFMKMPYSNSLYKSEFTYSAFISNNQYLHFPVNQYEEHFKASVLIEDSLRNSRQILDDVFLSLLQDYPFYRERNADRKKVIAKALVLFKAQGSLCEHIEQMNDFLAKELSDPHFYIMSKCSPRFKVGLVTPLYCYRFGERYLISAIIDSDLKADIPLGSELIEVNGQKISSIASGSANTVNQFLKQSPGQGMKVKIITPEGDKKDVNYLLKPKYELTRKLTGDKTNKYTYLNDSTSYYKINTINDQTISDFISNLDSINTKQKLILDFRNCGGGDLLAGARFLSCFIPSSFKYFDFEEVKSHLMDSVIVNKNLSPVNFRKDGEVVLIMNKNSACVTELLMSNLKTNRSNVKIVSSESSMGAIAFTYQIFLPKDNISIQTNAIGSGKILLNKHTLENIGLKPDILVSLDKVEDLAPYEDKVLKTALKAN